MMFLALMARDVANFTEAQFAPLLEPEAERVRELYAEGKLRAAYGRGDTPGAVLFFEAESLEEVHALIATLPLAAKGMLLAQVVPIGPYRGFGPRG